MSARVFISYAHTSPEHKRRIADLVGTLRAKGLNVSVDSDVQTPQGPLEGWPKWMKRQLRDAGWVLIFFDEVYRRRFDGEEEPDTGLGATWEGAIITNQLYRESVINTRFIPLLADDANTSLIPDELVGATYYRIPKQSDELACNLFPNETTTPASPPQISPTRLRHGADHLFGREDELAALDRAWNDPAKHILTIVAWGGVGKTSLVFEWMARQAAACWPGFDRVFDWSFYSQGTREQGAPSANTFIAAALEFFGDPGMAKSAASPWDKGARLAQLVAQQRTLLALDGMEPLQYPPGPMEGELKDPALKVLLKGLAQRNPGLCIVTTREHVADLAPFRDTTSPEMDLTNLSVPAGIALLKSLGVEGAAAEFEKLVNEVNGHALTLNLLGRYLTKAHHGDIRKRDLVKFEKADAKVRGGHAFKTIAAYERWFASGGEDGARLLAVLRLLGLFDRPADEGCMTALRRKPSIKGLTAPLVGLGDDDWNIALSSLDDLGLVTVHHDPVVIDAHPLIREYFAGKLQKHNTAAWRAGHQRLYEHLKNSTEKFPSTLEGLQPLYQAVAHGCRAGLYQEACDDVYTDRILRGTGSGGFYSWKKLGAIGSDLGAVACFFEEPWKRPAPSLSEADQAWLLNEAALRLRALGRLTEALEPMRAGLDSRVEQEHWKNAAVSASNLSELGLTLGEVPATLRDAEQSVDFADRSEDAFQRMSIRTTLADALHQAGRRTEALELFRVAETMQAEDTPNYPQLYSLRGFQYCDLLLAEPERAAWIHTPNLKFLDSCRAVTERAAQTFKWAEENSLALLTIAFEHLTLGRSALYASILNPAGTKYRSSATEHLHAAVDNLRSAGAQDHLPRGLLSRAWLRFLGGDTAGAQADLDEAQDIAERGPMKLHLADVHLYRARLFHDRAELAKAAELIETLGYGRRNEELADAREEAKGW